MHYQLKTIQSERNLARGSEKEIEGGAVKFEAAALDPCELFSRRSVSGIAQLVATRERDFCQSEAAWQYRLVIVTSCLVSVVLVMVRVQVCHGCVYSGRGMVPAHSPRNTIDQLSGIHGSAGSVDGAAAAGAVVGFA